MVLSTSIWINLWRNNMSLVLPFPGQSRNILLVGDEGITIFNASGGGVRYIDQLAWLTPDFEDKLSDTLRKDCPKKPIVILYDMVEQHYRKERVPKVGPFDKANVIKRKVAITFPNYKMRAALALKASKSKSEESKGLKSSPYLFAAVPSSELMSSLLRGVVASGLPIRGLYLLPVEGVGLINKVSKKVSSDKAKPAWTLFIGQHGSGNLRQIVTKDGELALTRMTPFSEQQENTQAWSQSIFQEYKVTISYLSRLGYNSDDGIEIILVGPEGARTEIENYFSEDSAILHQMSVDEAASYAGVKTGLDQDSDFADLLYVAWAGQATKFALPLPVESFERATKPRLIANVLMVLALGATLWFGYQSASTTASYLSVGSELKKKEALLVGEKETYARLLDEKEREGYDIRLYKGAFEAEKELNEYALKPFTILKGIATALGPVLSIDDILIRHADDNEIRFENLDAVPTSGGGFNFNNNFGNNQNKDGYELYSRLSMTFAASVPQEEAQRILEDLVRQLGNRLPNYTVSIEKAVRDRAYEIDVEGQIGVQSQRPELQEDNTAVIEIRGAVS